MGVTHLVCVRRSWAVSRGMRGGSERGGDPNGGWPMPISSSVLAVCSLVTSRSLRLQGSACAARDETRLCLRYDLQGENEREASSHISVADDAPLVQKYTVQRKAPIGRHERVLAIDGDYIHIVRCRPFARRAKTSSAESIAFQMPSEARTHGFPSSMRTSSYHISAILDVKQSRKTPSSFKLVVAKDAGSLQKRYDFEGENGQVVAEIVGIIKDLCVLFT